MSSGERPIGTAKGKQPNTEALCQPPSPSPDQSDHRRKKRHFTIGKMWSGHFWYTNFWVPDPPPPRSNTATSAIGLCTARLGGRPVRCAWKSRLFWTRFPRWPRWHSGCVHRHRTAQIPTQSKTKNELKLAMFHTENAGLLSESAVVATGKLTFYWALCLRCAHAAQERILKTKGAGHLFLTITHPCLFLPPLQQTIWSTFSPCLRLWPILCTQFMMMARLVIGSGGSDILCC